MLKKTLTAFVLMGLCASTSWADESAQYNQKTLPNGDVETTYSSSDGTKVVTLQHKNGDVETTATTADGAKSVTTQHADGSSESHMTTPSNNAN